MTGNEVVSTLGWIPYGTVGVIVAVLLGLIKVKPLEISVWHWFARKLGRAFNGETIDKLKTIEETLNNHLQEEEEKEQLRHRTIILRFADEMYQGIYHSQDHFEEIIDVIKKYDNYCDLHPGFKNGRTETAAKIINDQYQECLKRRSFEKEKEGDEADGK